MAPKVVRVPKAQGGSYNEDRPLSPEGLALIAHWHEAEARLPRDQQTGIDINAIRTQGQANAYTQALVAKLLPTPLPQHLSLGRTAGVAIVALAILSILTFGLVWVTKQISSIPLLILIICAVLLFFLILIAVVLLISGHLSESVAGKLFTGILGKIPGLDKLLPKPSATKLKD